MNIAISTTTATTKWINLMQKCEAKQQKQQQPQCPMNDDIAIPRTTTKSNGLI